MNTTRSNAIKGVPIYSEISKEYFVKEIEPKDVDYCGINVKTAPLAFGRALTLLGLTTSTKLLSERIIDCTDNLDPESPTRIKNIYYKLDREVKCLSLQEEYSFCKDNSLYSRHYEILTIIGDFKIRGNLDMMTGEVYLSCISTNPNIVPIGYDLEFYRKNYLFNK